MRNRRMWWLAVPVVVVAGVLAGLLLVPSSAPGSPQAAGIPDLARTTAVHWGDVRQTELTAAGLAQEDHYGNSVALSASGSTALVGAPFYNGLAGTAYAFAGSGA